MHPLLSLIANATESELDQYVEYPQVENQVLGDRLPAKIDTTKVERDRLLKVGKPLWANIKDLMTIVTPRTFQYLTQAD